jgi:uncharacterized protein DUF1559
MFKSFIAIVACTIVQIGSMSDYCLAAEASNQASIIAPFLNDDTFAVAHIDVASLKPLESSNSLLSMLSLVSGEPRAGEQFASMANDSLKQVQDSGVQSMDLAMGLGDLYDGGGPILVITPRSGTRLEEMERALQVSGREAVQDPAKNMLRPLIENLDTYRKGDVLLVGTKGTLNRYAAYQSATRTDLVKPLAKLTNEGAVAAAVVCPGPDFRRVVRELWPAMPGSLAPLSGDLLADRFQHLELAVNSPPDAKPRLMLQTRDAESAQLFARLWQNLPNATTEFGGNPKSQAQVKGYVQLLVGHLPAKADGTRVTIGVPTGESDAAKLTTMISTAVNASMESGRRRERMDRFKQISLAMVNYESAKKHLPAAAIYDNDGRPLLSWRVAILPYLEQGALYKQFHLDEPWDSPHNRALVAKMPKVYADPDPQGKKLAQEGKTTYQVPVGPETVFYKNDGTKVSEIKDGTSRTILFVEVEPKRAVVWTKPEDWEVDMAHPRRGVARDDRNIFAAARCDVSVHAVPVNIDEKILRALLTRAGGDKANP